MTLSAPLKAPAKYATRPMPQWWFTLLGCLCLMPNPTIDLGNFRLQAVNFVLVAYGIFWLRTAQNRAFNAWLLLAVPAAACAVMYLSVQTFPIETLKLSALWLLGTAHIVPGTPRHASDAEHLLKGISIGILVTFGVCLLQVATVPFDAYPIWSWYGYGEGEKDMIYGLKAGAGMFGVRVFGLFSEPSDMTASIGHWWLLICALRLGVVKSAFPRFATSRLSTAAMFAGGPMLMLSRSGHSMFVAMGFVAVLFASLRGSAGGNKRGRMLLVFALVAALCVGLYDLSSRITSRDREQSGHKAGEVWEARAGSIVLAAEMWSSSPVREFVFGLGYRGVEAIKVATDFNIWSVIGKSVLTFGFVALAGWIVFAALLFREIVLSRAPLMGFLFCGICVIAISITTSYEVLVSPWLSFAMVLSWRRVFGERTATEPARIAAARARMAARMAVWG